MRRAWEHLNPGIGQGSLFANTVVITDTALTPASCPHLRARSHHGATTYRSLFIQKAETSSYRWTTHTSNQDHHRACQHNPERSRSKRIRRTSYGHRWYTKHDTLAIEIITVQAISSRCTSSAMYVDMWEFRLSRKYNSFCLYIAFGFFEMARKLM